MKVKILKEAGREEALLGLSLSYNTDVDRMPRVANHLSHKDGGHNKFLESICVWLDITAPRYWWQQFDTYRVGITKQSESTMHTLLKNPITQDMFCREIPLEVIKYLEKLREEKKFEVLKATLPESFLQRRIVATNYKALRHIYKQRITHKLPEWGQFCTTLEDLAHPEYIF